MVVVRDSHDVVCFLVNDDVVISVSAIDKIVAQSWNYLVLTVQGEDYVHIGILIVPNDNVVVVGRNHVLDVMEVVGFDSVVPD